MFHLVFVILLIIIESVEPRNLNSPIELNFHANQDDTKPHNSSL